MWTFSQGLLGLCLVQALCARRPLGQRYTDECEDGRQTTGLHSPRHCDRHGRCELSLNWQGDQERVVLELQANVGSSRSVWAAVGFSHDQNMGASDVVVCLLDREGVVNLRDGWNLPGAYINVADKEQGLGLELLNGSIVDTTLTCRFSRLRQSSDLLQDVNLTHPLFLLLASGPVVGEDQLSLGKHDHVAVSSQLCVLTLCGGPCRVAGREWLSYLLLKAHGIAMAIVFLLFIPSAAFIARHYKHVFPETWFLAHQLLAVVSVLLLLLAVIFILAHTHGTFSVGLHQICGGICLLACTVQLLLGFLRPAKGPSLKRNVFRVVHRILATVILTLGVVTVFLGALLVRSVMVATVVSLAATALTSLAAVKEVVSCGHSGSQGHPLSYRKVLREAGSDSEDEVFSKQEEDKAQRQPQLLKKEKGLLLLFVGVAIATTIIIALAIASFSCEEAW